MHRYVREDGYGERIGACYLHPPLNCADAQRIVSDLEENGGGSDRHVDGKGFPPRECMVDGRIGDRVAGVFVLSNFC